MPFIRVDYMEGQYTKEQLSSISKVIQSVLIEQFDVPPKDYFQVYQSHEDYEFYYDPEYFHVARTDKLLYIYVTLAPGRSQHKKLGFYQKLSSHLSTTCSIRQEDIFIMLVESERENWSFGNGLAQAFELNNGGLQ